MCRNAAPVGIYTFVLSIQLCNLKIVRRVDTLLVKKGASCWELSV